MMMMVICDGFWRHMNLVGTKEEERLRADDDIRRKVSAALLPLLAVFSVAEMEAGLGG